MPIRITGLNSGLDTEAIISALVSSYNYKTEKYKKAQTKLSWKQDAWKELNTKIYSLYTSVGNLRFSSAYNMKKTTVSDATKVSITAGTNALNGSYSVQITSLAKAGYLTGGRLAEGTTASSTLADLGYTGADGKLSVNVGGSTKDITVSKDTTIQEVVNQLKDAGVNASYDETNRRIFVSAKETGEKNDFALAGANGAGTEILTKLGLNAASTANTAEYTELASYLSLDKDGDGILSTAEVEAIVTAKKNAEAENTTYSTTNSTLAATNANYQKALAYLEASKSINSIGEAYATANPSDAEAAKKYDLLKELATASDLDKKYVKDNEVYTYDEADGKYYNADKSQSYTKDEIEADTSFATAEEAYDELGKAFGLVTETTTDGETVKDTTALDEFKKNLATVVSAAESEDDELKGFVAEVDAVLAGTSAETAEELTDRYNAAITANDTEITTNNGKIADNNAIIKANERITSDMTAEQMAAFAEKVNYAKSVLDTPATTAYSEGATRVNGSSAVIYVNGAEYVGDSNTFAINGMTITATGVTGTTYDPTETNAVNATINTDTQGIYDKVKDFLTQYNALMNEMTSLFNAESSKGYEPLTDEERDALSDSEVEKWEAKIKDSLLRRDNTLSGIISSMTSAMAKSVKVNGKDYYLADFGIRTLGYFNAPKNQQNALHIDGDEDDTNTSGNADKLMKAIAEDPDTVLEFMQGMAKNLYEAVDKKMKSTSLKTIYTVYNDKEMASEYSDYTSTIRKWQERLEQQEEYYYQKFAAMETALSKINSQTSALSGWFG